MIEKEGKMQVEITGARWETIETTDDGDVDIAKLTIKDAHDNTDEMSMWLSSKLERGGKYKDEAQYVAVLARLESAGMTDGDPANLEKVIGSSITISVFKKEGDKYCKFYWQDGSAGKPAEANSVAERLKKLRGQTEAMAGTPTDDDNLPF